MPTSTKHSAVTGTANLEINFDELANLFAATALVVRLTGDKQMAALADRIVDLRDEVFADQLDLS